MGMKSLRQLIRRFELIRLRNFANVLLAGLVFWVASPQEADARYCGTFDGVGPCAVFSAIARDDLRPLMNAGNILAPKADTVDTAPAYVTFNGVPSVGACRPSTVGGLECISHYAVDTWSWILGDGSGASGSSITHFYPDAGTFPIDLTVNSVGELDTSVDVLRIPPNTTPVLDPALTWEQQFQWSPRREAGDAYDVLLGEPVVFSVRIESRDPFQEIYIEWDWEGDGVVDRVTGPYLPPIPEFPETGEFLVTYSHNFGSAGTYTPTIRLRDSKYHEFGDTYFESAKGLSGWYARDASPVGPTLIVENPPITSGGADVFPRPAWIDSPVSLYAQVESEIPIVSFEWDIGADGSIDTTIDVGESPNTAQGWYTFTAAGEYALRARSVDEAGVRGSWIDVTPLQVVDIRCEGDADGDGVPCWADWNDAEPNDEKALVSVRLEGAGLLTDFFDDGVASSIPLNLRRYRIALWNVFTGLWAFNDIDIFSGSPLREGMLQLWATEAGASCSPFSPCDTAYLQGWGFCYQTNPISVGFCEYRAVIDDDQGDFDFVDDVSIQAWWSDKRVEYSGIIVPFVGGDITVTIVEVPGEEEGGEEPAPE